MVWAVNSPRSGVLLDRWSNRPWGGLGPRDLRGLGDCLVFADHEPAPTAPATRCQPCAWASKTKLQPVVLADSHLTSPI
jgi:hypothetical protein